MIAARYNTSVIWRLARLSCYIALLFLLAFAFRSIFASTGSGTTRRPATSGPVDPPGGSDVWQATRPAESCVEANDDHPIRELIHRADDDFSESTQGRSKTFKETVERYRIKYGRHPPPDFDNVCLPCMAKMISRANDHTSGTDLQENERCTMSTTFSRSTTTCDHFGRSVLVNFVTMQHMHQMSPHMALLPSPSATGGFSRHLLIAGGREIS